MLEDRSRDTWLPYTRLELPSACILCHWPLGMCCNRLERGSPQCLRPMQRSWPDYRWQGWLVLDPTPLRRVAVGRTASSHSWCYSSSRETCAHGRDLLLSYNLLPNSTACCPLTWLVIVIRAIHTTECFVEDGPVPVSWLPPLGPMPRHNRRELAPRHLRIPNARP
jgi:hypothetical protein